MKASWRNSGDLLENVIENPLFNREEVARCEHEKSKLEDRVHELERNLRNQGRLLEQATAGYEDELRNYKNTIRRSGNISYLVFRIYLVRMIGRSITFF